jgi:hypothetical protein
MPIAQGDLGLLDTAVAQDLLSSTNPVKLAYTWLDGSPRVVPMWFHWNGTAIVVGTPVNAPKIRALRQNPRVALTIDGIDWPYPVLYMRGTAAIDIIEGVSPEYAASASRYFGVEQGPVWVETVRQLSPSMARITITPEWVGVLDFQTRFPSALGI